MVFKALQKTGAVGGGGPSSGGGGRVRPSGDANKKRALRSLLVDIWLGKNEEGEKTSATLKKLKDQCAEVRVEGSD